MGGGVYTCDIIDEEEELAEEEEEEGKEEDLEEEVRGGTLSWANKQWEEKASDAQFGATPCMTTVTLGSTPSSSVVSEEDCMGKHSEVEEDVAKEMAGKALQAATRAVALGDVLGVILSPPHTSV